MQTTRSGNGTQKGPPDDWFGSIVRRRSLCDACALPLAPELFEAAALERVNEQRRRGETRRDYRDSSSCIGDGPPARWCRRYGPLSQIPA